MTPLDSLRNVPAMTDCPTTRAHAKALLVKVEWYAKNNLAMLGSNGIAPAVTACLRQARSIGFKKVAA